MCVYVNCVNIQYDSGGLHGGSLDICSRVQSRDPRITRNVGAHDLKAAIAHGEKEKQTNFRMGRHFMETRYA